MQPHVRTSDKGIFRCRMKVTERNTQHSQCDCSRSPVPIEHLVQLHRRLWISKFLFHGRRTQHKTAEYNRFFQNTKKDGDNIFMLHTKAYHIQQREWQNRHSAESASCGQVECLRSLDCSIEIQIENRAQRNNNTGKSWRDEDTNALFTALSAACM